MKTCKLFVLCCAIALPQLINAQIVRSEATGPITQSLQVINLLANTNLTDPGMTTTPVVVKYYNGYEYPCWVSTLGYQTDTTVHAGPGLGCGANITEVIVSPMVVAEKLHTYKGPNVITLDPTKFSYQLTILQDKPPIFDSQSGLVISPGTVKIHLQSMLKGS